MVFSTVFYPAVGGIENQTLILLREFVNRGHSVKVITTQIQHAPLNGITVYNRPGILKSIRLFLWCSTYYMPNISLKGVWLLLINPRRTWVISHNDFSSCNKKGIIPILKNLANKFASTNIAVSRSIANCLETKAAVVHNCYDDKIFRLLPEEARVFDFVFLGRLVSQKGCDLLIRACSDLKQPFSLNIIGEGSEKTALMELVSSLGLENSVTFSGLLRGETLTRTLNQCRVMVIPSLQGEGFGMVALEGLACGCRIIAADAAGLAEAVGEHGEKFDMGDQIGLTKLLRKAVEDKDFARPDQKRLEQYLKSHSSYAVADNYLKYFS